MSINSFKIQAYGTSSAFGPSSINKTKSSKGTTGSGGIPQTGACYSDYLYWNRNTNDWEVGSSRVHIGCEAGFATQGDNTVAVGNQAGLSNQSPNAIAIGNMAGINTQGTGSVGIGFQAGATKQGEYSVAIGYLAGNTSQSDQTIVINASSNPLDTQGATGTFFVKPIRQETTEFPVLQYNPSTGEITWRGV